MSYKEKREALIPAAMKEASEKVEIFKRENKGKYIIDGNENVLVRRPGAGVNSIGNVRNYMHDMRSEYFHEAMNRMSREKGLVR
jgi:hypothetical protein